MVGVLDQPRLLTAEIGKGCYHCVWGIPIDEIRSRAGVVKLCLECVLLCFPGKSVTWWEVRHIPMRED